MTDQEVRALILDVIEDEGEEYTNRPDDRGGPTKFGITQRTLARYRKRPVTPADVAALTKNDAVAIYTALFVEPYNLGRFRERRVAELLYDLVVNHGPSGIGPIFQRALGVAEDGVVGPRTIAAADALTVDQFERRYVKARVLYYARIVKADPSQVSYIVGWMNRVTDFLVGAD